MNQPRATLAAGMQVTPSVRLLSPLGAGGMGAVWLADHTALNTRVVVKFMLGGLDSSTSARLRFKREAEAASQVKSPHVVQTFDYGLTSEGVPFIVMEHLEGRDLGAEIAARGALDPVMVITVVTQIAKALSRAHAAGLLHRDIKPDNIFLCQVEAGDELFVKLLDFGIAKSHAASGEITLDGETKTGQVVGTPFYMSPEQVTAQKVIDLRSDLWSLGIVAFEALTGKRPYDGPSFGALAVKIATGAPPKPSEENAALPASVDAWFEKACAREPAKRFASARELAETLRAAFEGVVSLPPIVSGAMSDSGARGKVERDSGSGGARVSASGGGPISVDDESDGRPSFVLASTLAHEGPSGEGSAERSPLASSEGGAAVAIAEKAESPETIRSGGPPARVKLLVSVASLIVILLAIAIGWEARERTEGERAATRTASANASPSEAASSPPSSPRSRPATALVESVTPSATPIASPSTLATATPPVEDAGATLPAPSHQPSAHVTLPVTPPVPQPVTHPPPSASVKVPAPPPSSTHRPNDDPLY